MLVRDLDRRWWLLALAAEVATLTCCTSTHSREGSGWWQHSTQFQQEEAAVHGEVRAFDLAQKPLAGVRVEARILEELVAEATTDTNGQYRLAFEVALTRLDRELPYRKTGRYWQLKLLFMKPGFVSAQLDATVPHGAQPLPVTLLQPASAPSDQ